MKQHYLNCRLGREWYGIAIEYILEVLHMVALNELPTADFLGVITLRERLLPVIDLRLMFGETDITYTVNTPLIALQYQHYTLGVVVDEIDTVIAIPIEQIAPFQQPFIQGIANIEPMLFILDIPSLIQKHPIIEG